MKRSCSFSASLWKLPARSNQVRSLKFVTSVTSTSPSHRPTEWPIHVSSGGPSTLSRCTVRAVLVNSYAKWILFVLCVISNGYGMYVARGIPGM